MKHSHSLLASTLILAAVVHSTAFGNEGGTESPNILVIMTDDVSPYDISAYHRGLGAVLTPNIDRLAKEGMMLSDFYAQPSCTAGRAAFLTGQYPIRTGMTSVGQPGAKVGWQKEDPGIAELLAPLGYRSAYFGKYHNGDRNEFLPTVHGFEEFFGFLYHLNVMEMPEQPQFPKALDFPGRPRNVLHTKATNTDDETVDSRWGRVGRQTIEDNGELNIERMKTFDDEVTERTLEWMRQRAKEDSPFCVVYAPTRMHQQIHVSNEWRGKSGHSEYADGLLHLDSLVGKLLDELDTLKITDNTIVVFTSDNGVNEDHWPQAGVGGPFRGQKGVTWDGGFRVPALARWPGRIPAGEWTGELMTMEDWLPTLVAAAGEADLKQKLLDGHHAGDMTYKVHLDGYNQLELLTAKGKSKRREFFFYGENDLNAARVDHWKIHFSVKDEWLEPLKKLPAGLIVDIKLDPFERAPRTPGHFLWMKEKTWILPIVAEPIIAHAQSFKKFPPRQKGSGIGAAAILGSLQKQSASD